MESEQENRVENILDLIQYSYDEEKGWTEEGIEHIQSAPFIKNIDLTLRDNDNNLILYNKARTNFRKMHNRMMGNHNSSMMNRAMNNENYITEKYVLKYQGEKVGEVEIGTNASFIFSEEDIVFTKGINNSIFYAAIISIIFAIIFGLRSAVSFSKPIIKINKTAQDISKGDLSSRITTNNKIKEIKELSNSINTLGHSLEQQEKLRKQLTSDISHELRTPITIIQSQIEAIGDGLWDLTPERIQTLNEESNRLLKLVSQLKYLTNVEGMKDSLECKEVNISELIKEVIEGYRITSNNKKINIKEDIEEDVIIQGDKDKLKQVFMNLLSNALKFTNDKGTIAISLKQEEEKIVIIFRDNGIGIPQKDLENIFERFYRSDQSRNRNTGGAGIGLAIVKSIIEAHKGSIIAKSKEEEGTEFQIILPIK